MQRLPAEYVHIDAAADNASDRLRTSDEFARRLSVDTSFGSFTFSVRLGVIYILLVP